MDFAELKVAETLAEKAEFRSHQDKRYVIGCDIMDEDTILARTVGMNVFIVFDKHNMRTHAKVWTKKTMDEFIPWYITKHENLNSYVVSRKFIDENGNIGKIRA